MEKEKYNKIFEQLEDIIFTQKVIQKYYNTEETLTIWEMAVTTEITANKIKQTLKEQAQKEKDYKIDEKTTNGKYQRTKTRVQ